VGGREGEGGIRYIFFVYSRGFLLLQSYGTFNAGLDALYKPLVHYTHRLGCAIQSVHIRIL
jgi:hypothetical protein